LLQADYLTPSHAGVVHGHDLDEFFITPGQQRRTFGDEQRLHRRSPRHLLRRLCSGGPCVSDCGAALAPDHRRVGENEPGRLRVPEDE
jgi:hypothetical protein